MELDRPTPASSEFLTAWWAVWNDLSGCLDCACCSCCFAGRQVKAVEDVPSSIHWPTCCLTVLIVPFPCVSFHIRKRVVQKYQIVESSMATKFVGFCLFPLSLCQTMRELGLRDTEPGGTCCTSTPSMC